MEHGFKSVKDLILNDDKNTFVLKVSESDYN